jgi:hypothetical protein
MKKKSPDAHATVSSLKQALWLAHERNNGYIQRLLDEIKSLRRSVEARDLLIVELKERLQESEMFARL